MALTISLKKQKKAVSFFGVACLLSALLPAQLVMAAPFQPTVSFQPTTSTLGTQAAIGAFGLPTKPSETPQGPLDFNIPEASMSYYFDEATELDYFKVQYCASNLSSADFYKIVTVGVTVNEVTWTQNYYAGYISNFKTTGCRTLNYMVSSFDIGVYESEYGGRTYYGHEAGVKYEVTATLDILYDENGEIQYESDGVTYVDVYAEENEVNNLYTQEVELTVDNSKDIYFDKSAIVYSQGSNGQDQVTVSFCQKNFEQDYNQNGAYDLNFYLDLTVGDKTVRKSALIGDGQACGKLTVPMSEFLGTEMSGHAGGYYSVIAFLDVSDMHHELYEGEKNKTTFTFYISDTQVDFKIATEAPYKGVSYDAASDSFKLDYCFQNLYVEEGQNPGVTALMTVNDHTRVLGIPYTSNSCTSVYFSLYEFGIGATYGQHGAGDYSVYAMIESMEIYAESSELNNEITKAVHVDATASMKAVDLKVTGISYEVTEDAFKIDYCAQNIGDTAWVGIDLKIDDEVKNLYFDLPDFGGQGCASAHFKTSMFINLTNASGQHPEGYHDAVATIDANATYPEYDELNNTLANEGIIIEETRIDLVVTGVSYNVERDGLLVDYSVSHPFHSEYEIYAAIWVEINGAGELLYVNVAKENGQVATSPIHYFAVGDAYGHGGETVAVVLTADIYDSLDESDENNGFEAEVYLPDSRIDFTVQSVIHDAQTDALKIEYCASNRNIANTVGLKMVLNGVAQWTTVNIPQVYDLNVPSCLTFYSNPLYTFEIGDAYAGHAAGSYAVEVTMDYNAIYAESNESNNTYYNSNFSVIAVEGSDALNLSIKAISYDAAQDLFLIEYCGDGITADLFPELTITANGITQKTYANVMGGNGSHFYGKMYSNGLSSFAIGTGYGHDAQEVNVTAVIDANDTYDEDPLDNEDPSTDNILTQQLSIPDTLDAALDLSIGALGYDANTDAFTVEFCESGFNAYGTTLAKVTLTVEGQGAYSSWPVVQNWDYQCGTLFFYVADFGIYTGEGYPGGIYQLTAELFADKDENSVPDSDVQETDSDNNTGTGSAQIPPAPVANDEDGDGVKDEVDQCFGTEPLNTNDTVNEYGCALSQLDTDGDGLSDYDEMVTYGTNKNLMDTDGDGYNDGVEVNEGTDPLNGNDHPLEDLVIHTCDKTMDSVYGNWYPNQDTENVHVDTTDYKEGTGSVGFDTLTSLGSGNWAQMNLYTAKVQDLSTYQNKSAFRLWVYIPEIDNFSSVQLQWGNESYGTWYKTVSKDYQGNALKEGWNLLEFTWTSSVATTGSPRASEVDFMALIFNYTSSYTDQVGFKIDDFKLVD